MFKFGTPRTVDSLLAGFDKLIQDLKLVASEQAERVAEIDKEIIALDVKRVDAENERVRALAAVGKVESVFSV